MEISLEQIQAFLRQVHLFAKLSDEELAAAAENVEVFAVPAGEVIYRPGEKSDGLYLVYRGKIQISSLAVKGSAGVKRTLSSGDYFGEESLAYEHSRLTQAAVRGDSIVLRVKKRNLEKWIEDFPKVITPLRLIQESFLLVYNRSFNWLARGEKVQYASRRTRFVLWKKLLIPAAITSIFLTLAIYLAVNHFFFLSTITTCLLLLVAFWVGWLYSDWLNDFLVVTNHRIVSQEKVILLYDTRQETPLEAVQAFGIETDQWGRWFGYGTIVVRSFTGNQPLKEIENPNEVISILEEAQDRAQSRRKEEDRKAAEVAVRMRLGLETGHRSQEKLAGQASFFESGFLPGWIANLFQVRLESGDTITYRTHWIKLFQSQLLPTLVLILIPIAVAVCLSLETMPVSIGTLVFIAATAWALAFGVWIYRYIDWHNDCYMISSDQIVDVYKKPLGIEERRTASYSSVLGIEYSRKGLPGLLFNYGTVHIKIGDSNFAFDNVYNPSVVQQELFQKLNKYTLRQKKAAEEEERERMADFIESYHKIYKSKSNQLDVPDEGG
ncbi:MAG: cyclic nucleotide-binding domain-containing protein [Anaerolineaceae bacterium]